MDDALDPIPPASGPPAGPWRQRSALAAGSAVRQPATACAGPPSDTWLDITIDKVRSDQGVIAVTVYPDDPHKFLIDGGSLYVARVPARADKTRMCLFLPHTGVYALAVYHDEDNSGTWNRVGPMGLPAEGFGFRATLVRSRACWRFIRSACRCRKPVFRPISACVIPESPTQSPSGRFGGSLCHHGVGCSPRCFQHRWALSLLVMTQNPSPNLRRPTFGSGSDGRRLR
jgi:uncharacterized protein (DUF2141 family)